MKHILIIAAFILAGCSNSNRVWDMDPRLANLAEWAYACMLDVTGLDPDELPVPPVLGVDEPWGEAGYFGTYYSNSSDVSRRRIKVQITRPYAHLVNIMLHEMGHDGGHRLGTNSEEYANWINEQCSENVRPEFYPAPPIDW